MWMTTLNKIRSHSPCEDGYKKLCKSLGGIRKYGKDTPITIRQIVESNGLDDALWTLRTMPEHNNRWRLLAVRYARTVQHLMADPRSLAAMDVAERHARGLAEDAELTAASNAAWAAALDAARAAGAADAALAASNAAWAAARAASNAAWAASNAAWAALDAADAARAVAGAAWDAAWAVAWAAWDAADAAGAAARDTAVAEQTKMLIDICEADDEGS